MSRPSDPSTNDADDLRDVDLTAWAPPPAPAPDVARIIAMTVGAGAVEPPASSSPAGGRPWRYAIVGGFVVAAAAVLLWWTRPSAPPTVSAAMPPAASTPTSTPTPTPTPMPATPALPPRPNSCAYEDLLRSTKDAYADGRWADTRRLAEDAIACNAAAREPKTLALLASCKLRDATGFKRYYGVLGSGASRALPADCLGFLEENAAARRPVRPPAPVPTAEPAPCDYEALLFEVKDAYGNAEYRKSFAAAERAIACNRSAAEPKKFALLTACKLGDRRAFDRYYPVAKNKVAISSLVDCFDFLPTE